MLHTVESSGSDGGSWLSDNPEYKIRIQKLAASDPRLRCRDAPKRGKTHSLAAPNHESSLRSPATIQPLEEMEPR